MPADSETSTAIDPKIASDLACAQCGYNLRMQPTDGTCPECDLAVSESLSPDALDTAPRGWLGKQLAGVWIQFASYLLSAVAIVAEMYRSYVPELSRGAMMALRIAPLVGIAVAVWLLTTPRPNRRVRNSTRLVRYGFAAVLLLALILPGTRHQGFDTLLGRLGWTLFFVLLVVCWIGLGCIQVRIARTLGLPLLALSLWAASIAWSIALAATAVFYVFKEFTQRSLFSRAEPAYVYALVIGGVLVVLSSLALAIAFTSRRRGLSS